MRNLVLFFFLITTLLSHSQNQAHFVVKDSLTKLPLFGAKVIVQGTRLGGVSDVDGNINLSATPAGEYDLKVTYVGYEGKTIPVTFPLSEPLEILLVQSEAVLDEIMVEATRSNRTIANLPTRTEVLTDEIDEAASMEPSKISHLITHSTGIQVQTTASSSNGAVVRIQGLNGRYTQMLKDGFPLYGGFSGSLDVLQIPPLDLRQVEYVKGPASTLYGGGAIGGLINLLSKKPDKDETLLHLNLSHIGAKDFNFFAAKRFGKFGFTNLASFHMHDPYDPDNNGFTDVPEVLKMNFNPRLFFYPDDKSDIYLGFMVTRENRMAGDLDLVRDGERDSMNFYYDKQKTFRLTTQFSADREFDNGTVLTVKNSFSSYDRYIEIGESPFSAAYKFAGIQKNSFTEFNFKYGNEKHDVITGINIYTEEFDEKELDTSALRDQQFFTYGLFANHLWDIHEKFALESGLRFDYAIASNEQSQPSGNAFVLPRLSALWKVARTFSIRAGGGLGYRMPTVFTEEAEPLGYRGVAPIDFDLIDPERSYGGNVDFKFISSFGTKNILLSLNQMFFYNVIDNPILLNADSLGGYEYANSAGMVHSRGFESQIKLTFWWFTWFAGYTYTDAYLDENGATSPLVLNPKHSLKGDLLFVVDGKWRIGWDYEFKSFQYLANGTKTRDLFSTGVIVERTLKNFVIFLNAENFTDVRQSRYGSMLSGPYNTPQYTEVWAPLDGFFFNAGLKVKLN